MESGISEKDIELTPGVFLSIDIWGICSTSISVPFELIAAD